MIFDLILEHRNAIWNGFLVTVKICVYSYFFGTVAGVVLTYARSHSPKWLNYIVSTASHIVFSVPILVILFWLHYPLQYLASIVIDPFLTTIFALSIVMSLGVAEILLEKAKQIDKEYTYTAVVSGLTEFQIATKIKLPLIARTSISQIIMLMITISHGSLFASLISVNELFRVTQQINSEIYRPVELYTILAIFFVIACYSMFLISEWMKRKYDFML